MQEQSINSPLVLALIGAGRAGRFLAEAAIRAGHMVILEDVLPSNLRTALDEIETAGYAGRLRLAVTVEDAVRDANLAIDFVPDELESKLEILSMIDRMAPPKTIICTPTHALSLNDLASCTYRADRCVAVDLDGDDMLTAVRLVAGLQTSLETMRVAGAFWHSVSKNVTFRTDAMARP